MKSFKDRGSGLFEALKMIGFGRLASVASTFYKLNKIRIYIESFYILSGTSGLFARVTVNSIFFHPQDPR